MLALVATELDDLLDEVTAAELDDLLVDVAATELEDRLLEVKATELDDLLEGAIELTTELATELAVPPQTAAVRVAPFLPTPATVAILSFTHCGVTGE